MVGKILVAVFTAAALWLLYNLLFAGKAEAKPSAGSWDGAAYAAANNPTVRAIERAANTGAGHF